MTDKKSSDDPAVNLIRQKVGDLYGDKEKKEPSAKAEIEEVQEADQPLSKHQAYMKKISNSGLSLAEVQSEWHKYYSNLPDAEKHEVWQEFYAEHDRLKTTPHTGNKLPDQNIHLKNEGKPSIHQVNSHKELKKSESTKTVGHLKEQLSKEAAQKAHKKSVAKQHFQSMLFGVGVGLITVLIMLFGFFNERFIAPFITPSRNVSNTPIIVDGATAVSKNPMIIIPKINVEIPVVYDEPSVEEHAIQNALERGVVHYATTPNPGEKGNAVIFGHSSNNILNKGKYKFAFVLLSRLDKGDTFYLDKDGKRYAYEVFKKEIVSPTELSVLGNAGKTATATLITCDPPGTSRNRLIVVGQQVSPDPAKNIASTAKAADVSASIIPSNAPSLWQRVKDWLSL